MGFDLAVKGLDKAANLVGLKVTKKGHLYTAKNMPDYASLVNAGKVFSFLETTTTVALVARPTTTASVTLQNPASSGKHYIVFELAMYTDVVPASLGLVTVWHCVHKLAVAALTRDLTLQGTGAGSATSLKAGTQYAGSAIVDRGATVVDDGWVPTPLQIVNNIASTNFISNSAPLVAPVIIPPGLHYSLQTTATVTTFESALGMTWAEVDEDELD
jgi:hypothetical protein